MGMGLTDIDAFLKRFRRKPSAALALLVTLVVVVALGAFVTAYFSEWGKRAAEPAETGNSSASKVPLLSVTGGKGQAKSSLRAQTPQSFAVEQITLGTNSRQSRVDFALRNNSNDPIVVSRILMEARKHEPLKAVCADRMMQSILVSVSELVMIDSVGGRIKGRFEDQSAPGFDYPVSGFVLESRCDPMQLRLQTEHTVKLPAQSVTIWHLVLPRTVSARELGRGKREGKLDLNLAAFHTITVQAEDSRGRIAKMSVRQQPYAPKV
jgi:hypothetical protein